jgi:hypothetical protein
VISKEDRIFSGVVGYFPNALAAIGRWSAAANEKHNPGEPMHWAFPKSTAHLDAAMSHLTQAGRVDPETGVPHLVNAAWRVLAALETSLIEAGATPGVNVRGAPAPAPPAPPASTYATFDVAAGERALRRKDKL